MIKIMLEIGAFEYDLLKTLLEEEIDRNTGTEFETYNYACKKILKQIRRGEVNDD